MVLILEDYRDYNSQRLRMWIIFKAQIIYLCIPNNKFTLWFHGSFIQRLGSRHILLASSILFNKIMLKTVPQNISAKHFLLTYVFIQNNISSTIKEIKKNLVKHKTINSMKTMKRFTGISLKMVINLTNYGEVLSFLIEQGAIPDRSVDRKLKVLPRPVHNNLNTVRSESTNIWTISITFLQNQRRKRGERKRVGDEK